MAAVSRRNTLIELIRFLFTMFVIIAHIYNDYEWANIRCNGHIAVEFFFILSGYLMTAKCFQNANDGKNLPQATWQFLKGKVVGIAPVWYTVLGILIIRYVLVTNIPHIHTFITRLAPSLLFVSAYGMKEIVTIPYSWYIPVMLVSMFILYPLIRTYGRKFTAIAAPIVVLFFCGWAVGTMGKLFMLNDRWIGFVYPQQIRGICELCMGCVAYEMSEGLRKRFQGRLTLAGRLLATLVSVSMFALPMVWIFLGLSGFSHPAVLLMFAVGVATSFSTLDLSAQIPAGIGKVFAWLGKISLAVYLGQGLVPLFFDGYLKASGSTLIFCLIALCIGVLIHYIAQALRLAVGFVWRKGRRVLILPGDAAPL